jgi:hypothetical protein
MPGLSNPPDVAAADGRTVETNNASRFEARDVKPNMGSAFPPEVARIFPVDIRKNSAITSH